MHKRKIAFCYFGPKEISYTPTDIGYIVAIIQRTLSSRYEFEILQLNYEISKDEAGAHADKQQKFVQRDVDLIEYHQPDAVFICIENVLWSKVFALGRATKVMEELRRRQPSAFIGLQSYKMNAEQMTGVLESNLADCVIGGDAERIFLSLDAILEKEFVPGVRYKNDMTADEHATESTANTEERSHDTATDLDHIPSPYLDHVFDNYIQSYQTRLANSFRAFLFSSRGCGFGCYYCFRSTKFEKVRCFSVQRFYDELEYLFNNFQVQRFFVLDDGFLYSKKRLKEFDAEFQSRLTANPDLRRIDIMVMARPETVDEEVIQILAALNVRSIQFGLQTVNPDLQRYMKRSMDVLYFKKIKEWLKKYNMKLCLDIVVGLPGDSIAWLKETLRYALLLDPFFLQIKQFYLNPNTLFQVNRSTYEIEIEDTPRDFNSPYVIKAKNIDEAYFTETDQFIMKQIEANPQIFWKYLTRKNSFLSKGWLPRSIDPAPNE